MIAIIGHIGELTVIRVEPDRLDVAIIPLLAVELERLLAQTPVLLDLSRVRFADSVGLGLLVSKARPDRARFRIANVDPRLRACFGRVAPGLLPPEVDLSTLAINAAASVAP